MIKMNIYDQQQIYKWDQYTIKNQHLSSIELMKKAGQTLGRVIVNLYPNPDLVFYIFCGKGNNGGDGLVIANFLRNEFREVVVYECNVMENASKEFIGMKSDIYNNIKYHTINDANEIPLLSNAIIIDALFGIGLSRPLNGLAAAIIEKLNSLTSCITIAIDVPSGMMLQPNAHSPMVRADHTLSIGNYKLPFLWEENCKKVGIISNIDIGLDPTFQEKTNHILITKELVKSSYAKRKKFSHKGTYGKALLCCGSKGMGGAAIISGMACLRSGVGLLYMHTIHSYGPLLHSHFPEAIVIEDEHMHYISSPHIPESISCIGVGSGIGVNDFTLNFIRTLLNMQLDIPIVFDADAINVIATYHLHDLIPKYSIFTPHPKEFERLFGKYPSHQERVEAQIEASIKFSIFIILKGANTTITTPEGKCYFNIEGNAGMAKGGSGDALTGLLTGLIAKTRNIETSCINAVYLHGLAGNIAMKKFSIEGYTVTEMVEALGEAWKEVVS